MSQYTMTIDGQAAASPGTLRVVNPATGAVFAEVPDCTREQLDAAMASAQRAFQPWKDDDERRRAVMHACADALEANAAELGRLATLEQGMPLASGAGSARRWACGASTPTPTRRPSSAPGPRSSGRARARPPKPGSRPRAAGPWPIA
jgi:acyl-CoA reductase-like NAD-dependent aldehyde dehydrogenase